MDGPALEQRCGRLSVDLTLPNEPVTGKAKSLHNHAMILARTSPWRALVNRVSLLQDCQHIQQRIQSYLLHVHDNLASQQQEKW